VVALAVAGAPLRAQTAYRSHDVDGQWVFSDRAAGSSPPAQQTVNLTHAAQPPHVAVERADSADFMRLVASNNCLCVATVRVTIEESDFATVPRGAAYRVTLQPGERHTVAQAPRSASGAWRLQFTVLAALGAPTATHAPPRPYRVPFAIGATFLVSQAYPTRVTHVTPDSAYAVDFALPDGTPVYAAREGTVINVRHDSFRGAAAAAMLDQANLILILHDDGTIGVYGHLQWDSIRVHIGQHVARGEYIANSGNTGFTTGPHLHFAVWRNNGTENISVPVQFAGIGGVATDAATATPLTAY